MKKSVYSSICIVMLMGLLPFRTKAQQVVVIYPYMNYLNMPCDNPSEYTSYTITFSGGGSGNVGRYSHCNKDSLFLADAFNYPIAGKPETRLIYGVAFNLRSRKHRELFEIDGADSIYIELYKVTEGEADIHLIKKCTDYLYPGKKPDKILMYQPVEHHGDTTIYYTDPLYEFYFNEPVSVTGTFLVNAFLGSDEYTFFFSHTWPRPFTALSSYQALIRKQEQKIYGVMHINDVVDEEWIFCDSTGLGFPAPDIELEGINTYHCQAAFPILVPEGTTAVPTVEGGEPFEVLLTPNPAAEQATAATEAGIRSIEVVDMAGRTVVRHSYHALPRNVTFDVKALPRGIYAVRVDTPQGIATKKLAVE